MLDGALKAFDRLEDKYIKLEKKYKRLREKNKAETRELEKARRALTFILEDAGDEFDCKRCHTACRNALAKHWRGDG